MKTVAIIGAGPAGMMAAEILSAKGFAVTLYERKPSVGRKFLMAGRGGLNLTHSENADTFMPRYGGSAAALQSAIDAFTPQQLRDWADGLGEETFVGSSGRVFPKSFKASPLLRAWQQRLLQQGVALRLQHDWRGWTADGSLLFVNAHGTEVQDKPDATLLALGGASWPRLGSDGGWVDVLRQRGLEVKDLVPANCGFHAGWTDIFRDKFSGQPVKPVALSFDGRTVKGEIMIDRRGVEGGAVYALSGALRDKIAATGSALLHLDLSPDIPLDRLTQKLQAPRQAKSFSNFLRTALGLSAPAAGLLRENADGKSIQDLTAAQLAARIKNFPLTLTAPFDIDRAISSAGGLPFAELDGDFMLTAAPGVFVAGEMIDWDAPTGGYLLQACFSTAARAAGGISRYLSAP